MTRITRTLLGSSAILATGLAIVGALMFAFTLNAQAHQAGAKAVGSKLEVSIADNGRVIVRGAEVTDINGDAVTARTEWGASALTWTVDTDSETVFVEKDGSDSRFSDLSDGDYISFSGTIDESGTTFTIDADTVKNWSLGTDDGRKDKDADIRADVRAEVRSNWGDWMKKMPILNWFGGKHENR